MTSTATSLLYVGIPARLILSTSAPTSSDSLLRPRAPHLSSLASDTTALFPSAIHLHFTSLLFSSRPRSPPQACSVDIAVFTALQPRLRSRVSATKSPHHHPSREPLPSSSPFISLDFTWQRVFSSGFVKSITAYAYIYFNVFLFILVLLFLDSVREVSKYSEAKEELDVAIPNAEAILNMKLFRAQRNFYVAGFAFFLFIVLKRMCNLISVEATLIASNEASMKQAQGAADQAKRLMEEVDDLQKELESSKNRRSRSGSMADIVVAAVADSEVSKDLKTTREDLEKSRTELEKTKKDLEAVRKQAEGVTTEYDRLLQEHSILQKQLASSPETKKDT